MRRPSITEDILVRSFSRTSGRLSVALRSLSAIPENKALDVSTIAESFKYGSIERGGVDEHAVLRNNSVTSVAEDRALLRDELINMIALSLPVIATYLLEIIPGIVTLALVGRLNNEEDSKLHVDAAALAVMMYNILGFSTGLGLMTALDTLCASANGANQPSKMGRYLLTGIAIMLVTFCIVGAALYNTTSMLLYFGQPPSVAREAGVFMKLMLPGLPFLYVSQARGDTLPMILSAVTSVFVNVVAGYYLTYCTACGWLGAAIARSLGLMVMPGTVFIGMYHSDREFLSQLWEGFQVKEALSVKSVGKFLSLGIPGMFQLVLEWVAFEVMALFCGIIPGEHEAILSIGANAIVYQVALLFYACYFGLSVAGSVSVGNALGAGDVHRAKMASGLSIALGALLSSMNTCLIIAYRGAIASFFTSDEELISKTADLFLIVALYQLPDAINCIEQGIFRAVGLQSLAATSIFVGYYLIGLPLGYVLGLPLHWGAEGLWVGVTVALVVVSAINSIILLRSDWGAMSEEARKRVSIAAPGDKHDERSWELPLTSTSHSTIS
ncbi:hypothetical protein ACHAXT_003608 [Thalassiosira profunda]